MSVAIPKRLAFSEAEYKERLSRVRTAMQAQKIDVLITHSPENIYYLSGYQTPGYFGYHALVVPQDAEPLLVMRRVEIGHFDWLCYLKEPVTYTDTDDPPAITARTVERLKLKRPSVGLERKCWFLTPAQHAKIAAGLPNAEIVDGDHLVERCRHVKSENEIKYMRDAARTSEKGVAAGIEAVRAGTSDNAVAAAVHQAMIAAGSEYVALGPFIATGLRTTIVHGIWSRNTINAGESVMLEVGGCVNRYHAALFRTISVGPPSEKLRYMAEVSDEANSAAIAALRPGVACGEVHEACQRVFRKSKLPDDVKALRATMRSGYSIGIAFAPGWGEWDTLAFGEGDRTVLEPGMTFHIPSAIREYGVHGAAYSETVLVTPKGHESLTQYPRRLFVK